MIMGSLLFFLLFLLYEAASEPEVIVVQVGQNVTLPCQTGNVTITTTEWTRSEPEPSKKILLYKEGQLDPDQQHPSFKDRVHLVDDQLKTRNVSLILKNVKKEDVGTYRCRVVTAGSRRKKRAADEIKNLQLQVTDSEPVVVRVGPEQLGQDVTLECQAGDVTIRAAEWTRSTPQPSKKILLWRDGHSDQTKQHSSFKGRVQLVDGELKTGNVSLILKNVSREDVGTYGCRVVTAGSRRNKRAVIESDPIISIVQLQLTEDQKGDTNNIDTHHHGGLAAAVGVFLLVSAAVGLFLVRKSKRQREKKPE